MNSRLERLGMKIRYEDRLAALILAGGLPAVVTSIIFIWSSDLLYAARWTLAVAIVICWLGFSFAAQGRVIHPLRTLTSMLAGLREGDFATRARSGREDDALGELFAEANLLSRTLSEQRRDAVEATALLRSVMAEIDVAVFAFDGDGRLKLVNRAAEELMGRTSSSLLGLSAASLDLEALLSSRETRVVDRSFPGGTGRWGVRVGAFWERGLPHQLLVLHDLTRELREEQIAAWKRLVRVIGHELNNSLTPIKSIATSLQALIRRTPPAPDWREDTEQGLAIIAGRAESLVRFMEAYSSLAKLPPPRLAPMSLSELLGRVASLETRMPVRVATRADVTFSGDSDQLEQLLINLLRNAVDAALQTGGAVDIDWWTDRGMLEVRICDEGPGLPETANLFVPFFTTKSGGSGIGLVLSRQIAEAHGGEVTLVNREDRPGCRATLRLPL